MRLLSVVIPTKNEAANIANCIRSFRGDDGRALPGIEVVVVDNSSSDGTRRIAAELGARVFEQGPERCAQRNRGWQEAEGEWILFLDADMIVPRGTVEEILGIVRGEGGVSVFGADAYWIPEVRTGNGLRLKARNFERSFYNGTVIDGFRLIRREALAKVGGYDEKLVACEDWDLDRRLAAAGVVGGILKGHLFHNEAKQDFRTLLKKKAYYSKSVDAYRAKWNDDAVCRKQFGLSYRFLGVFVERGKWKKLLSHPVLAAIMYFERFSVGFTYLLNR